MPNGPTSKQLKEWYKNFSEILLKNADIDVTKPGHLGLIKNIQVTKWDTSNPDTPDVKIDYAKLNRYELALSAYVEEDAQWERDLDEKESYTVTNKETGEVVEIAHDDYRLARYEHEQYAHQLEAFKLDPLGEFSAIANSLKELPKRQQFWTNEKGSVAFDYESTPLGKARKELDELEDTLGYEERTDVRLHNWWGHDADPSKVLKYSRSNPHTHVSVWGHCT